MASQYIATRIDDASAVHERALQQLADILEQYKKLEDLLVVCKGKIETCTNPERKKMLQGYEIEMKDSLKDIERTAQQCAKTVQDAAEIKAFLEGALQIIQN